MASSGRSPSACRQASAAAAYFARLLPLFGGAITLKCVAVSVIALFAALNYRGAKPGAIAVDQAVAEATRMVKARLTKR